MDSLRLGLNIKNLHRLIVTVGRYKTSSPEEQTVAFDGAKGHFSVMIHETYHAETLEDNIALIILNRKVSFNDYIRPICLLSPAAVSNITKTALLEGETAYIAGSINKICIGYIDLYII